MPDITVIAQSRNGTDVEIYLSQVEQLFDEYCQSLSDPEMIHKSATFAGAMRYIYERLFRPTVKQPHNRATILDTADIQTLDSLWGIYAKLCYRAGIRPTLLRFSLMSGVSMEAFNNWKRGDYRSKSPEHCETIKRWLAECESSIYDGILDNQVGAIFAAKADFQWRETSPTLPESYPQAPHDSAEAIAQRHASARLPERPAFDEVEV